MHKHKCCLDDDKKDSHIYEFQDQGGILLVVNDEDGTDRVRLVAPYHLTSGRADKDCLACRRRAKGDV